MGIFVDQVGYLTGEKKEAVTTQSGKYFIKDEKGKILLEKEAVSTGYEPLCGEELYRISFSELKENGSYYIEKENGEKSYHFQIAEHVYKDVHNALLKALYYLRCGCELDKKYAGKFAHKICHNKPVFVYEQPEKSFECSGGWHDAGDYGRYVSPGAVTVGHLLYAYELFPEAFQDEIQIPESGNGVPDVLNESRYELTWLLKMQREDGGAYHKATAKQHAPFIMPEDDLDDFYAWPVSSMATGDFCAVMALASRIYEKIDSAFAEQMALAAKKAWNWLVENKEPVFFKNPFDCGTGEYDDTCDEDERLWAATEMYFLAKTKKEDTSEYLTQMKYYAKSENISLWDFGWTDVSGLATLAVLTSEEKIEDDTLYQLFYDTILNMADQTVQTAQKNGFAIGMNDKDFVWGSNMVVTNKADALVLAFLLTKNEAYKETALAHLHYLLGENITNYSFVTCYGEGAYKNPHFRPMVADGIDDVLPGMVSGGPNGIPCDEKAVELIPAGTPPMKCFADEVECYSLNEITIYWNSSPLFLTAFINSKL